MLDSIKYFISHQQFKEHPIKTSLRLFFWKTYYKPFKQTAVVKFYKEMKISLQPMKNIGITGLIYIFRKFEEQSSFMLDYLKEGMTVLDIGANIGYYSLIFSNIVGQNGKVYSFEPTKSTYTKFIKNIELNQCKNIFSYNKALSNVNEKRKLYYADDHGRNAFAPEGKNTEFEDVECISLDEFINQNNLKVDFIKIDVEGAELLVLKGALNFLKNYNGPIYCEFNKTKINNLEYELKDLVSFIINLDFEICVYNEKKKKLEKLYNPENHNGDVIIIKSAEIIS